MITVKYFKDTQDVANKVDERRVQFFIDQAIEIDLVEVFGEFAYFLEDNKDKEEYKALYNGGTYGDYKRHAGIKKLVASYAYSRYEMRSNTVPTAFGTVTKYNQDSTPINYKATQDIVRQSKIDSDLMLKGILSYIRQDEQLNKEYNNCNRGINPTYNSKIYSL